MNQTVAGVSTSMAADQRAPPPPPPPALRRPRVREVSSRFLSPAPAPVVSSFSTPSDSPQHRLKTPTARRRLEKEGLLTCSAHENLAETVQSLDIPLGSRNNKTLICGPVTRKKRAFIKLFKENGGEGRPEQKEGPDVLQSKINVGTSKSSSKPQTPTVTSSSPGFADRTVPSRFRIPAHSLQHLTQYSSAISVSVASASDAAKLLQSSGLSQSSNLTITQNKISQDSSQEAATPIPPTELCLVGSHDLNGDKLLVSQCLEKILPSDDKSDSCPACIHIIGSTSTGAPFSIQNSRTRSLPDTLSSVLEGNMLPTLSTRVLAAPQTSSSCSIRNAAGNCQISKLSSASPCSRSLNLPLSSCENTSLMHSFRNGERRSAHFPKPSTNSFPSLCLPPQPTCMRSGVDSKKGRKPFTSHEQVHSLKLLHNHYLQWRFANAKAEATMHAQRRETESKLYSLGVNIADLRDSIKRKCIEFELLQRTIALVTIVEAQMPYLDKWSALEEDYSNNLSGCNHALENSSLRLPVSGNVQVDIKQVSDALFIALKTMDMIGTHFERLIPKAEEIDSSISELARVIRGERAVIEECGDLLFETYKSQVEYCSLSGHLMQLHFSNNCAQPQQE